jgi:Zn-dependent protease
MNWHAIIQSFIIQAPPFLLAISCHEAAHGWMAERLGDDTARMLGRVTLNPIKHLDPMGTLVFFLTMATMSIGFGWARPVPVTSRKFHNPRRDWLWVALAGPAANLVLAAVSAVALHVLLRSVDPATLAARGSIVVPIALMLRMSVYINVLLAIFNLLPVYPLDGSHVVEGLLPIRQAIHFSRLKPYGFVILLALIFTGFIDKVLFPLVFLVTRVLAV